MDHLTGQNSRLKFLSRSKIARTLLSSCVLLFLFSLGSCGIPVGGEACGDGVACILDPATSGIATAADVREGTVAYNDKGKIIVGELTRASLAPSTALRDKTSDSTEISNQKEDAKNQLSSIYSAVPVINGSSENPDHGDFTGIDVVDSSAITDCGNDSGDSVSERIADCNQTWEGVKKARQAEGTWELVSKELVSSDHLMVWKDTTTGLLWSDDVTFGGTVNWCKASGNIESGTACASGGVRQPTPESYCNENANTTTPASTADAKGNLSSSNGVYWRLPTKADWLQAELNGIRWVFNSSMSSTTSPLSKTFWSATPFGLDVLGIAWTFNSWGEFATGTDNITTQSHSVMCVASYEEAE